MDSTAVINNNLTEEIILLKKNFGTGVLFFAP